MMVVRCTDIALQRKEPTWVFVPRPSTRYGTQSEDSRIGQIKIEPAHFLWDINKIFLDLTTKPEICIREMDLFLAPAKSFWEVNKRKTHWRACICVDMWVHFKEDSDVSNMFMITPIWERLPKLTNYDLFRLGWKLVEIEINLQLVQRIRMT